MAGFLSRLFGLDDESVNMRNKANSGTNSAAQATYCGECEYYNNHAFGPGNAVCGQGCGHIVNGSLQQNCDLTGYQVECGQRCGALNNLNRVCQNPTWRYEKVVSSGDYACRFSGKKV